MKLVRKYNNITVRRADNYWHEDLCRFCTDEAMNSSIWFPTEKIKNYWLQTSLEDWVVNEDF